MTALVPHSAKDGVYSAVVVSSLIALARAELLNCYTCTDRRNLFYTNTATKTFL
jgi:hypothetical protein